MRKTLSAAAFAAVLALVAPEARADETCGDMGPRWSAAIEHFNGQRMSEAAAEVDRIILVCGEDPLSHYPRVMRAEIALGQNDAAMAIAVLGPVPRPAPAPIGTHGAWLYLRALQAAGRGEDLTRESAALVAASEAALVAAPINAERIESFEMGGYRVTALRLRLQQGAFLRRYFFLLAPMGADLPRSIAITENLMISQMDPNSRDKAFAVDEYFCAGHATLDWLSVRRRGEDPAPAYEVARAAVERRLGGPPDPVSAFVPGEGASCAFPSYITPGLDLER